MNAWRVFSHFSFQIWLGSGSCWCNSIFFLFSLSFSLFLLAVNFFLKTAPWSTILEPLYPLHKLQNTGGWARAPCFTSIKTRVNKPLILKACKRWPQGLVKKQTMLQKSIASPLTGFTDKPFTIFPPQLHSPVPAWNLVASNNIHVQWKF